MGIRATRIWLVLLLMANGFSDSSDVDILPGGWVNPKEIEKLKTDDDYKIFEAKLEKQRRRGNKFVVDSTNLKFNFGYATGACRDYKLRSFSKVDTLFIDIIVPNRSKCKKHIENYYAKGEVNDWKGNEIVVKVDFYDSTTTNRRGIVTYKVPPEYIQKVKRKTKRGG